MNPSSGNFYEFGKFRLDADSCVLLDEANSVIDLTPKALEILCVLVENGGRVVTKEEILKRVWAGSFVEEANLSHHIFRLRKALGESSDRKFIETIPKRGYRFVAEVQNPKFRVGSSDSETSNRSDTEIAKAKPQNSTSGFTYKKLLPAAAAIFLLIVCGAAFFVWYKSGAAEKQNQTADRKPQTANPMTITRIGNLNNVASSISPDGKFISYVQNYTDGTGSLYVRQIETNTESQLINPGERIFGATQFSPDGAFIYYIVYEKENNGTLFRIPVLGGQAVKVLDDVKMMFTLSPDGKSAAFFRDEPEQKLKSVIIANLNDKTERKLLTRRYDEMQFMYCPAISPDGSLVAFGAIDVPQPNEAGAAEVKIFTVNIASGEVKKVSDAAFAGMGMMNWMPDGSGIVFAASRPRIGNQIYFLSYPAGDARRITEGLNTYGNYGMGITRDAATLVVDLWETSAQLWSVSANGDEKSAAQLTTGNNDGSQGLATLPDGAIVYSSHSGDDYDLWLVKDAGGKREGKPLTSDEFFEGETAAAPDGSFIVFASDRAGSQHLFRIDADGANLRQLTFGDSFDSAPDISPDGKSIVYSSKVRDLTSVWKISIDGGAPVRLTDYESLAPVFSPDGNQIACILPSDAMIRNSSLAVVSAQGGQPEKTFPVLPYGWFYRAARWTPDGKSLIYQKSERSFSNVWKQDLSGGEPKPLTDFKSETVFNWAFSRDGKNLIVSRGKRTTGTVMLKNFKPVF